jgi:hypothetical protein
MGVADKTRLRCSRRKKRDSAQSPHMQAIIAHSLRDLKAKPRADASRHTSASSPGVNARGAV